MERAKSIRVLIADPDLSLLRSYREYLSRDGLEVATATNGLECVDRLRCFAPDLLVLELDMPWGGGAGVLELMHNERELPCVPVLMLTTRRSLGELGHLLHFEMLSDFHVKPLTPEELGRTVRRILEYPAVPIAHWETADDSCRRTTRQALRERFAELA